MKKMKNLSFGEAMCSKLSVVCSKKDEKKNVPYEILYAPGNETEAIGTLVKFIKPKQAVVILKALAKSLGIRLTTYQKTP